MRNFLLFFLILSFCSFAQNSPSINAQIEVQNYTEPYHICKDVPVTLLAQPLADTLRYSWLHNGQTVGEGQSFSPRQGGVYQLVIQNGHNRFTSPEVRISDCRPNVPEEAKKPQSVGNNVLPSYPKITSTNPVICGSNTNAVLTASPTAAGYTYQWYYSSSEYGSYTFVSGANSSTHTTSTLGYYKVLIGDGSSPVLSNAFIVSDIPQGIISDVNDNMYANIPLSGGVAQIKVTLYGEGPIYWTLNDGENSKYFESMPGTQTITVSPTYNKGYYISNLENKCGVGLSNGFPWVIVDNITNIIPVAPSSLNVCAGQTITLPYTTVGVWPTNPSGYNMLFDLTTSSYVSNSFSLFDTSPTRYNLPIDLIVGHTYKVIYFVIRPNIVNSIESSYTLTVTSSGCIPSATISGSRVSCGPTYLDAHPYEYSNPYTYQWYKDGVAIPNSFSSTLFVTQSGNYYVNVSRGTYNSNSSTEVVTISGTKPIITTNNKSVCGGSATTLTASNYSGTIEWFREMYNGLVIPLNVFTSTYTTTIPGYYFVKTMSGNCEMTSDRIKISAEAEAEILNSNMNSSSITITPGQSTTLNVSLSGVGPWTFGVWDGEKTNTYNSTTSVYPLVVSPQFNTNYSVTLIDSKCGSKISYSNSISVNVAPVASFNLNTPSVINVCQGSSISIPYTTGGTWPTDPSFSLRLMNSSNNYYNYHSNLSGNPIEFPIDSYTPIGTYNVIVNVDRPALNTVSNTYFVNVTAAGGANCAAHKAILLGSNYTCNKDIYLLAYPNTSEYTFQWYKNGVLISGASSYYYYATETGTYHVVITKTSTGVSSTSTVKNVTIEGLSSYTSGYNGTLFCTPTGGNLTLNIANNPSGTAFQWYKSSGAGGFSPISGANSSSYTATASGSYFALISKGNCRIKTFTQNTCPILITMPSKTVCKGSSINITSSTSLLNGTFRTFYLVNASTGLDVATLDTSPYINTNYSFDINLPTNIDAGTYKVRCTTPEGGDSGLSEGTITVLDKVASPGPSLTVSPTTFTSLSTFASFTASACLGRTYNWNLGNLNINNYTGSSSYSTTVNGSTSAYVSCLETNGCITAASSVTTVYSCADPLEPNNTSTEAKSITAFPYTSPTLCLDGFENKDWFKFVLNGNVFYVMASTSYIGINPGEYIFKLNLVGNTLTAETTPVIPGTNFSNVIVLYDANLKRITHADGNNGNGYSKIEQTLTIPCNNLMVLTSPDFDISAGTTSKPKAVNIEGLNKIANTATVDYRGEKSIVLKPGFETQISSGGVFKAQIKGCNDTTD